MSEMSRVGQPPVQTAGRQGLLRGGGGQELLLVGGSRFGRPEASQNRAEAVLPRLREHTECHRIADVKTVNRM